MDTARLEAEIRARNQDQYGVMTQATQSIEDNMAVMMPQPQMQQPQQMQQSMPQGQPMQ
jgi:hypothetical protein